MWDGYRYCMAQTDGKSYGIAVARYHQCDLTDEEYKKAYDALICRDTKGNTSGV
jgi:hypothetical protein